jgi:hypothetical protein
MKPAKQNSWNDKSVGAGLWTAINRDCEISLKGELRKNSGLVHS